MGYGVTLPSPDRFFEIRFESIGGLGAHAAGQILTTAAVLRMGLNGSHFSSYGSEKKGSVVRSFVRLAQPESAVRTSAPVEQPDVVVVFHPALLGQPLTLAGMREEGDIIVNASPDDDLKGLKNSPAGARLWVVDATGIALDVGSRANAVLLGALSSVCSFLNRDMLLEELSAGFAHRHPEAVATNERAFRRGMDELKEIEVAGRSKEGLPVVRPQPVWGYETAPMGGLLPNPGSTAWNDLSVSRTGWIPALDRELCTDCGLCNLVCPDLCLVWETEGDDPVPEAVKLIGVDYRYCKGCLRCIETCPTGALSKVADKPGEADGRRVLLFADLEPS